MSDFRGEKALLRAIFLEDAAAAAAFESWKGCMDLDDMPAGYLALMPQLLQKLKRLRIEHPWMGRLNGIYRRTWYANQLALHTLKRIVDTLNTAGMPYLVTGAAALGQTIYSEPTLRPIPALEIVVQPEDLDAVLPLLYNLGWQPDPSSTRINRRDFRTWVYGQRFVNSRGQILHLWWHVLPDLPSPELDGLFRDRARPIAVFDLTAATLDPTDHLLRTCLLVTRQGPIAFADAVMLLWRGHCDWAHLVNTSGRYGLWREVAGVLMDVAETLDLEFPAEFVQPTSQQPSNAKWYERVAERVAHGATARNGFQQRFWRHYTRYRRIAEALGITPGPRSFMTYLQCNLGPNGLGRMICRTAFQRFGVLKHTAHG